MLLKICGETYLDAWGEAINLDIRIVISRIVLSQVLRNTRKKKSFYQKSGKAGQPGKIYQFRGKFYQQKF